MKMKTILTFTSVLMLAAGIAQAAHVWEDPNGWWGSHWKSDPNAPKYKGEELTLDLFGSYINPEQRFDKLFKTNIRNGSWGGGAGLNYFITREIGLGTDFNVSDHAGGNWEVDYWVGNLYLRLPLGNSGLAPYLYGGGGRGMFPVWQWVYGGGVGLEYRFNPALGIFSDARFLWSDKETALNTLTIRAGLRIAF